MPEQNNITNSLAHTKWNCKYHVVFAPKYRRKVFYNEKRVAIRDIIRTLCQWKGVEIIEGEVCPDHIHLLLSIPPKMSVSGFMGYLKGKSSLMIFQKFGNMKFAYRNREFWCKGYYVDTVGKNTAAIKDYIANHNIGDKVNLGAAFCLGRCTDGVTIKIDDEIICGVNENNFQQIFDEKVLVCLD